MKKIKYFQAILELTENKSITTISMRDIANHMDLSTGSLYYHFKGKDDLLNQMFLHYKQNIHDYITTVSGDNLELLIKYLDYNFKHNLEFGFIYSSEILKFLDSKSLQVSKQQHIYLIEKLDLKYSRDAHITTIVFGTMRAYLMAPSYMLKCDQRKLATELNNIITNYKQNR